MDFGHYTDACVALGIELVNHWGAAAASPPPTLDDLRAIMGPGQQVTEALRQRDLPAIHDLADRLRAVFEANDDARAVTRLNRLLADLDPVPQISGHDGQPWHLHFAPDGASPLRLLAASAAMGLATVICDHGADRLGTCAANDCEDAFIDTSRNRSRRYCSETCASRANVAAYRARARGGD